MKLSAEERMLRYFTPGTPEECWEWTGAKTGLGYGNFYVAGRTVRAHRFVYEAARGAIPDGLVLDHLCRNPKCVNPAHLEPVTQRENILRGASDISSRATRTHCKRGHALAGENLQISKLGHRQCAECKRLHNRNRRKAAA